MIISFQLEFSGNINIMGLQIINTLTFIAIILCISFILYSTSKKKSETTIKGHDFTIQQFFSISLVSLSILIIFSLFVFFSNLVYYVIDILDAIKNNFVLVPLVIVVLLSFLFLSYRMRVIKKDV